LGKFSFIERSMEGFHSGKLASDCVFRFLRRDVEESGSKEHVGDE